MSHTDRARIYRDVRLSNVPEGARAIAAHESSQTTSLYDVTVPQSVGELDGEFTVRRASCPQTDL